MLQTIRQLPKLLNSWITPNLRIFATTRQPTTWILAVLIGAAVAIAAIIFRFAIGIFQMPWIGTVSERVASAAAAQPWWVIVAAPTVGGAIVGWMLQRIQPGHRAFGVADVIEARALGGRGLGLRSGLSSALITTISLGSGASAGREGPVVHLGATIGSALCRTFHLPDSARRILLACGVASAVSASFNAPIAGVLFAHEVILGHYAISALAPIVIASTMGTLVSRLWIGDIAAFQIPDYQISSYWEMPAFALLGLTCAAVAILLQFALIGSDWCARNIRMPLWLRPIIGGFLVGLIALSFPEVLGVGYEATDKALNQQLPLTLMLALIFAKTAATAITLASRFGGGIFSPALYLGAMAGGAFGLLAAAVFPEMASSQGLYSILGMGAVAAAVIGAPISTTLIVFELTGGYALSIALLITVSIATGLTLAVHGRSYFHWQLEMRGVPLSEGTHSWLVHSVRVADFYDPLVKNEVPDAFDPACGEPYLRLTDKLETALRAFDASGEPRIVVVDKDDPTRVVGWAAHVRALRYFNKSLIDATVEAHR